jgi:hypothetical protein
MGGVYDVPRSVGQAVLAMTIAGSTVPVAELVEDPALRAKAVKLVMNRDLSDDEEGWIGGDK